jgi:hypothetical protein
MYAIIRTEENHKELNKLYNYLLGGDNNYQDDDAYLCFPKDGEVGCALYIPKGYKEVSFEQFKNIINSVSYIPTSLEEYIEIYKEYNMHETSLKRPYNHLKSFFWAASALSYSDIKTFLKDSETFQTTDINLFKRMITRFKKKDIIFNIDGPWHVVVTKESHDDLVKWRGGPRNFESGEIIGLAAWLENGEIKRIEKGHNPAGKIKSPDYDFGIEISYEQFKKYILKKGIMEKNIIGYKAPMDLFDGTVKKGELYTKISDSYGPKNKPVARLEIAREIVEKDWEPVYEESFKVGDYVILNVPNSEVSWATGKPNLFGKITHDKTSYSGGTMFTISVNGIKGGGCKDEHMRKATPEEIEAYTSKVTLTLGSRSVKTTIYKSGLISPKGKSSMTIVQVESLLNKLPNLNPILLGGYDISYDKNTRFIRIGCTKENNLFSINELELVVKSYKDLINN